MFGFEVGAAVQHVAPGGTQREDPLPRADTVVAALVVGGDLAQDAVLVRAGAGVAVEAQQGLAFPVLDGLVDRALHRAVYRQSGTGSSTRT